MSSRPDFSRIARRLLCATLLAATAATPAWAHRPRVHFGVGVNLGPAFVPYYAPAWHPWNFPPPTIYQAPIIIRQEAPPVYVERTPPVAPPPPAPIAPAPVATQYWYYCPSSRAYYPHVASCPEEWLRVLPQER